MMKNKRSFGDLGENAAVKYLRRHHFRILGRNLVFRHGELDIVASNRDTLVFVEVKTRTVGYSTAHFGSGASAVDKNKQKHLISAARSYLARHPTEKKIRFDVIELNLTEEQRDEALRRGKIKRKNIQEIRHTEGAFITH